MMFTPDEEKFIAYWEQNRNRKKRLLWQLAAGLPLGVFLAITIFLSYFSQWYHRAVMMINASHSGTLVVLIAVVLIVVFVVVFSGRHNWDMNEQRYRELMRKKDIH